MGCRKIIYCLPQQFNDTVMCLIIQYSCSQPQIIPYSIEFIVPNLWSLTPLHSLWVSLSHMHTQRN